VSSSNDREADRLMAHKLSLLEAAPLLGVSVHTLRAWTRERRISFHRLGRRIVFDRDDLEAFLRANRIAAHGRGDSNVLLRTEDAAR